MATTTLLFTFLSVFCVVSAQKTTLNITRGASLTPTNISSWVSSSGLFAFGFYRQGSGYRLGVYMANISEKTVVWTANRDNPPVSSNSTLLLTKEGNLIVRPLRGTDMTIIQTSEPIYSASMLNSGNFVLYGSNREVIWQSFDYPTDTILQGQSLTANHELVSCASENDQSSGTFRLVMQLDGNLVQYPVADARVATAYWASNTWSSGYNNASLNLDNHGNLYLLNSSVIFKNLTQGNNTNLDVIFLMRLDYDGIFRTYSHTLNTKGNWSTEWENLNEKCAPKGLCGLNSYCDSVDGTFKCNCLTGFELINPLDMRSGCERNFASDRCKNKNETINYNMTELPHTNWEDVSYSTLSSKTKEECQNACLEDCNCEVALFNTDGSGSCRKQRLPLRYGTSSFKESNSALIKLFAPVSNPFPHYSPSKVSEKQTKNGNLIISFVLVAIALLFLATSVFFIYKSRVWAYKNISNKENIELGEDVSLRSFTFAELKQITNNFTEELGRGAFGTVYKGIISQNQQIVAVKRLERGLTDGEREFQTEIKVIGRTHHRNLIRLIGYCLEGPNKLLVYEYMSNGSLADLLVRPQNCPSWDERIPIALDIARGILYLHEECETQIIHCDIKPQNILMNEHMHAKICDFGLVKLLKPDQTKTYTGIRGTRGYVAPEWHRNLPVTVKADVYSFGIVLLEIICCRKSVDWNLSEEEAVLEEWVYNCFEAKELKKLVGDHEQVHPKKLERMVKVGIWCIQDEPSLRPSMKKVVLMLEGTVEIPVPPNPSSILSTV